LDPLIKSQPDAGHKPKQKKDLRTATPPLSAPFQHAAQDALPAAEMPPDLAQVVAAWRGLPPVIRAAIVAVVQTPK